MDVPPIILAMVIIFAAVLVLIVVFFVLMNRLRKARPTVPEFERAVERMSNDMLDQMNTDTTKLMEQFRAKVAEDTKAMELKLEGGLASNLLCSSCLIAKENLILHILGPLERAGQRNNFSTMLSRQMFGKYRSDLMAVIKDRHLYLQDIVKKTHCTITEYYIQVDEITALSEEVTDHWLYKVLSEYTEAINGCLEICYEYKRKFKNDDFRVGRIDVRIGKYQDILKNLEKRFINDNVAVERRAS